MFSHWLLRKVMWGLVGIDTFYTALSMALYTQGGDGEDLFYGVVYASLVVTLIYLLSLPREG